MHVYLKGSFARFRCDDQVIRELVQSVCDGSKIRGENEIFFPVKALPKVVKVVPASCSFTPEAKNAMYAVSNYIKFRKSLVQKYKDQYKNDNQEFDYELKGKYAPLKHQITMFNIIANINIGAILADPGTCKTGPYLWAIDKRIQRGEVKKCLIITLNHLKENIMEEMSVQIPHLSGVMLSNKKQSENILHKSYKVQKKNIDYDIYISNYESMFNIVEMIDNDYFQMVILDEAHRVGSPKSRQTKSIVDKFEHTKYKYIVTGTLNANSYHSFYMPFRFLGPDTVPQANFYEFRRVHFYPVDPDKHIWVPAPGIAPIVSKILSNVSIFFNKEECLDLPPKIYQEYKCSLSSEQLDAYESIKRDMVIFIEDMCSKCNMRGSESCNMACENEILIKNVLVMLTKLAQITCGFYMNTKINVDDNGKQTKSTNIISFKQNPKLDLLISTVNNIPSTRKIIIWSNFVYSIKLIEERISKCFGKDSCISVYGSVDAFKAVKDFQRENVRFLIANPAKASAGLNIQFSNYQIFFSNNYSYIQRDQSESRQHRQGQEEKVTIIDLACAKTIDEIILKILKSKKELALSLMELSRVAGINTQIKGMIDGWRKKSSNQNTQ